MAKPIKETPILVGKDAIRFHENLKNSSNNKISEAERKIMFDNYNTLKKSFQVD